jgi:carbon-monoxide dehydrogenase medium subunit
VAVEVPRFSRQARFGFYKLCRKAGEFAKAIGIAVLDPELGVARVLAGAVEGAPVLLPVTAARLLDGGPQAAVLEVADEISVLLPQLTGAERALRTVAVRRAIVQLSES